MDTGEWMIQCIIIYQGLVKRQNKTENYIKPIKINFLRTFNKEKEL